MLMSTASHCAALLPQPMPEARATAIRMSCSHGIGPWLPAINFGIRNAATASTSCSGAVSASDLQQF
jgi:hypothetical protein